MLAMAIEYTHAEIEPIADRCENWGRAYVDRMRRSRILSLEGRYRNSKRFHYDYDPIHGTAPDVRPYIDQVDAGIINNAWQGIPDAFHQMILGGHYVRRWSPNKCSREARKTAGMDERVQVSEREYDCILQMAHGLLEVQLTVPAVVRRERLRERVRFALELDAWGAV